MASINGVSSSYLLSEVLSALAVLNLFMQKMIADFRKLPFMLKSILDHLNTIRKNDASWFTAAETAILNLEIGHGITINGLADQNSTEMTSFVNSTVSSTSGYSPLWYTESKH